MTDPVRRDRVLLAGLGLVLIGGGGAGLLVSTGRLGRDRSGEPVLAQDVLDRIGRNSTWWLAGTLAVCVLVLLVATRWALAQTRTDRAGPFRSSASGHRTTISTAAVGAASRNQLEGIPGVAGARVTVHDGLRGSTRIRMLLMVDGSRDPAAIRAAVEAEAVPALVMTLADRPVQVVVRLRPGRRSGHRTV